MAKIPPLILRVKEYQSRDEFYPIELLRWVLLSNRSSNAMVKIEDVLLNWHVLFWTSRPALLEGMKCC